MCVKAVRAFGAFFVFFIIFHAGFVFASARVFTLDECIKRAVSNREILKAKLANVEVRRQLLRRAKNARFVPKFDVKAFTGLVPDVPDGFGPENNFPRYDIDWGAWGIFFRVQADVLQPIYTFGRLGGAIDAAAAGVDEAELEVEAVKEQIAARVSRTYWAVVLAKTILKFLDDVEKRLDKAENKVEELLAEGSTEVSEMDKFRLRLYRANLRKRRVEAESGLRTLKYTLSFLMCIDLSPDEFDVADGKIRRPKEVEVPSLDVSIKEALSKRPEVLRLSKLVEIRRGQLKSERGGLFPQIFLGGRFVYAVAPDREDVSNPFLNDEFNTVNGAAVLGLKQDLSFHLALSKVRRIEMEIEKAEHQRREVEKAIRLDVQTAWEELNKIKKTMNYSRKAFKNARSWVAGATLNFNVGVLPTKDLLEALVAYSETLVDYYRQLYKYRESRIKLAKAVHASIPLESENAK